MKRLVLLFALGLLAAPAAGAAPWRACVARPCSMEAFVGAGVNARWGSAERFPNGSSLRIDVFVDEARVDLGERGGRCSIAGRARGVAFRVSACRGDRRAFRVMLLVRSSARADRRVRVAFRVMGAVS